VTSNVLAIFIIGLQRFITERNYAVQIGALTDTSLTHTRSLIPLYAPPKNLRDLQLSRRRLRRHLSLLDVMPCTLVEIYRPPRFLHIQGYLTPLMEEARSTATSANFYHLSHATSCLKIALFKTHRQILNLRVVKKLKQYRYLCIHCKMFTT
jgi:hypothetical protein